MPFETSKLKTTHKILSLIQGAALILQVFVPLAYLAPLPEAKAHYDGATTLAVNTDKASYNAGENIHISVSVLDPQGDPVCSLAPDALSLTLSRSSSMAGTPVSWEYGEPCSKTEKSQTGDYYADISLAAPDTYTLIVTASTPDGIHTDTLDFTVTGEFSTANAQFPNPDDAGAQLTDEMRSALEQKILNPKSETLNKSQTTNSDGSDSVLDLDIRASDFPPFAVQRSGPTRVFLQSPEVMRITVTANTDFTGYIEEPVPASFDIRGASIKKQESTVIENPDGTKTWRTTIEPAPEGIAEGIEIASTPSDQRIRWPVAMRSGDTYTLSYTFAVPAVSPEFYETGPLRFVIRDQRQGVREDDAVPERLSLITYYIEPRAWQIAADATVSLRPPSYTSNPGNWSCYYEGVNCPLNEYYAVTINQDPDDPPTADGNWLIGPTEGADALAGKAIYFALDDTPTDFVTANSVTINTRHLEVVPGDDVIHMHYRIVESDNSTAITASSTFSTISNSTTTVSDSPAITGTNDKTTWDAARLLILQVYDRSGGADNSYSRITAVEVNVTYTAKPSIVSAANQTFQAGDGNTAISQITITDTDGLITAANDVRIAIATSSLGAAFEWDPADNQASTGGTAVSTSKVANPATVTFEGNNSIAVIPVSTNFVAGETLTVSGLNFRNFSQALAPTTGVLQLYTEGAQTTVATSTDTKSITIKGTTTIANHAKGQKANSFEIGVGATTTELFRFRATTTGEQASTSLVVDLSSITGITTGDITDATLWADTNGDGLVTASTSWAVGADKSDWYFRSLTTDSANNVVYAMSGPNGRIYRCSMPTGCDTDSEWTIATTTGESIIYSSVIDLAHGIVYAGGDSNGLIFRCATITGCDSSIDWTVATNTGEEQIFSLAVDSVNGVIYAGSSAGGGAARGLIFRCDTATGCDSSTDWTIATDTVESSIDSLVVDSVNNIVYAGTGINGRILRCDTSTGCDSSTDWTIATDTNPSYIYSLAADPVQRAIYAGDSSGRILRCDTSTGCDSSTDWTIATDTGQGYINTLAVDSIGGVVYGGSTSNGIIFRCVTATICDSFTDWTIATDTSETNIFSLAVDPKSHVVYAGSGNNGLIFRKFEGDYPVLGSRDPNWAVATSTASGPSDSNNATVYNSADQAIYSIGGKFIYRCEISTGCDSTTDWTVATVTIDNRFFALTFDSVNNVLYAATTFTYGLIIRCAQSCETGSNWTVAVDTTANGNALGFDPVNKVMYAGHYNGSGLMLRCDTSTGCDTGAEWTTASNTFDNHSSAVFNPSDGAIYFASNNRIIRCATACDAGSNWTVATNTSISLEGLAYDVQEGVLYAGTGSNAGVILRCAGTCGTGSNWNVARNDPLGNIVYTVLSVPFNRTIFSGHNNNLFRCDITTSCDASGDWVLASSLKSGMGGQSLGFDPINKVVYAADSLIFRANAQAGKVSISGGSGTITFDATSSPPLPAGGMDYILKGTVSNIADGDSITFGVVSNKLSAYGETSGLKLTASGSVSGATHTRSDVSSISGTIYWDEGTAQLLSAGAAINIAVATGSTPTVYSTTTIAATGAYNFYNFKNIPAGTPITVWVNASSTFRASAVTKYNTGNITGLDLYQSRVIVKHEATSATTTRNADLDTYDGDQDPDIQYRVTGTALAVAARNMLYIAPGSEFAPGGNVTLHGSGGSVGGIDGDLKLATDAATTSILTMITGGSYYTLTLAGNWLASSTSIFNSGNINQSTVFNSTSTVQKNIIATSTLFANTTFDGSGGSWTFGSYPATTTHAFTITAGTVTAPSTYLAIDDNYTNNGSFIHNGGTTTFYGGFGTNPSGSMVGSNAFNNVEVLSTGLNFGSNSASTTNFFNFSGTVTAPSTYLSVSGHYRNSGTFTNNSGTTTFNKTSGTQLISGTMTGSSAFNNIYFEDLGSTKRLTGNASTSNLFVNCSGGSFVTPAGSILSIAGHFRMQNCNYSPGSNSTTTLNGASTQQITGMDGTGSSFNNIELIGAGQKIFIGTGNSGVKISGNYVNSSVFSNPNGTTTFSGTAPQAVSGAATGTSAFNNLSFSGAGVKTFNTPASTTNLYIQSGSGNVFAPSNLSISGNFTNNSKFIHNSGKVLLDGSSQQTVAGYLTASSSFYNLEIRNTSGTGDGTQSILFSNAASSTGTLIMQASTSARFPASATSSFANVSFLGTSPATRTWIRSSSAGTRAGFVATTSATISYVDVKDSSACGDAQSAEIDATNGTNFDSGNNCGWFFTASQSTLSSAANQTFQVGDSNTAMSAVTVTSGNFSEKVSGTNELRLAIATSTGVHMKWDSSDATAAVSGSAQTNGKISATPAVTFEGGGTIAVIPVISDFALGEVATISGLNFNQFQLANAATSGLRLLLDGSADLVDNTDPQDDKTVTIKGTTTIANHALGQAGNQIGDNDIERTANYFRFRATTSGERASTSLIIDLSGVSGITASDISDPTVYADTNGDGAVTAGTEWTVGADTNETAIWSMTYDPRNKVVYAGSDPGGLIYRCDTATGCDQTADWNSVDTPENQIWAMTFDSGNNVVYAGTGNSGLIYRCDSTTNCDALSEWTTATDTGGTIRSLAYDSVNGAVYAGANGNGLIYRCDTSTGCDSATDWIVATDTAGSDVITGLFFDSVNNAVYAGPGGGGNGMIFRCGNASTGCTGVNDWVVATDTGAAVVWSFAVDRANNIVYAAGDNNTYGLIFRCAAACANGSNWTLATSTFLSSSTPAIIFDNISNVLYAGATTKGIIYRCDTATGCDSSSDWVIATDTYADGVDGVYSLVLDSANHVIYGGLDSLGLIFRKFEGDYKVLGSRSPDWTVATTTWDAGGNVSFYVETVAFDSTNGVVYAGDDDGTIFRCVTSTGCDTGTDWTSVGDPGTSVIESAAFDSANNVMYFGTQAGGVILRCDTTTGCDADTEWTTATDTGSTSIPSLVFDSYNKVLYAGVGGASGQIFRCDVSTACDSVGDWTVATDTGGLSSASIYGLGYDAANRVVYAGSDFAGLIFRCDTTTACDSVGDWTVATDTGFSYFSAFGVDTLNNVLYAGSGGGGFIVRCALSTGCTGANDWTVATKTNETYMSGFAFDSLTKTLYATGYGWGRIYRCDVLTGCDASSEWTIATDTTTGGVNELAYDPVNSVMYAAVRLGTVRRMNSRAAQISLSGSTGSFTFDATSSPPLAAGAMDYILNATIANIAEADSITFGINANKISEYGENSSQKLTVSGTVSNATSSRAGVSISSAANQTFQVGDSNTAISTITVTQTAGSSITAANDLRIAIASTTGVHMRWDTSDTTASFGGSASGKASNPVSYEGGGTILVVPISVDFTGGETLTISGLSYQNFQLANAATSGLRVLINGSQDIIDNLDKQDDKTVMIRGTTTIANHALGQTGNQIGDNDTEKTANYFRFRATTSGERASTSLTIDLSSITGIVAGDITNATLYADTDGNGAITASTSWTVATDTGATDIFSIVFDASHNVLYAGDNQGGRIFRCDTATGCDSAGDWTVATDTNESEIRSLGIDTANSIIYAGSFSSNGLIFRCDTVTGCDDGADWTLATDTGALSILSIVFDPKNKVLYAGTDQGGAISGGIFRCDTSTGCDSSTDWTVATDTGSGNVKKFAFDSINNVLYAGSWSLGYIYRCDTATGCDSAGDWTIATKTTANSIEDLTFDPVNGTVYAASGNSGFIYRCEVSTGCGAGNWTIVDTTELIFWSLAYNPSVAAVYAGADTSGRIYKCDTATRCDSVSDWAVSTDTGQTSIDALGVDPRSNAVYAGSYNAGLIFRKFEGDYKVLGSRSPDWTVATRTVGSATIVSFAYDSANKVVYAGGDANGDPTGMIFRCDTSTACDSITDWTAATQTGGGSPVYSLAFDSVNNVIYAGSGHSGNIYRCVVSTGCGSSNWTVAADTGGGQFASIFSLVFDAANRIMYAGSNNSGIIYRCDTATGCDATADWTTATDTAVTYFEGLAFDSANKVVYAGSNFGWIFRCDTATGCDSATDWTVATSADAGSLELAFDDTHNVLYAGDYGNGFIFRCDTATGCDSSTDWTVATYTGWRIESLAVDSINGIVYSGWGSGGGGIVYRCETLTGCGPAYWTIATDTAADRIGALVFDPANIVVYAGGDNNAMIFRANARAARTSLSGSTGSLIFDATSSPPLAAGAMDYILNATIANIAEADSITFGINANKISEYGENSSQKLTVSGTVSNATSSRAGVSISSAANQTFQVGDSNTAISTITVTQTAGSSITAANDLRIAIASTTGVHMQWDTSDTYAVFGGTASDTRVTSAVVSYEGGGTVLVVPVSLDFAAGETLTIAGLSYRSFIFANAATSGLRVLVNGSQDVIDNLDKQDDKTVTIKGTTTIANHALGQAAGQISEGDVATTTEWFRFRATTSGERASTSLTIDLSSIAGIVAGDITNATLYADTDGNGFVSASTSWTVATSTAEVGIYSMAFDAAHGVLYAAGGDYGYIFRCDTATGCDSLSDWVSLGDNNGAGGSVVYAIVVDAARGVIYANDYETILRCDTTTGCDSLSEWVVATVTGVGTISSFAIDTRNSVLYAGADNRSFIFRCDTSTGCDAAADWTIATRAAGIGSNTGIDTMAFDSINSVLYAGLDTDGLILRCNALTTECGSADWTVATNTAATGFGLASGFVFDDVRGVLYIGANNGIIFRCETVTGCDSATDWTVATRTGGNNFIDAFAFDVAKNTIYAAGLTGIIFRCDTSTACDSATDWTVATTANAGSDIFSFTTDTAHNIIYAGTYGWGTILRKPEGDYKVLGSRNPDWTVATDTAPGFIDSFAFDSANKVLYAGSDDFGLIFRCETSTGCDSAGDWTVATDTAGASEIFSMTYDSANNVLYAGGDDGGNIFGAIFRCDTSTGCDSSTDWTVATDTGSFWIYSMTFDASNKAVYAGTRTHGFILRCDTSTGCDSSTDWIVATDTGAVNILSFAFDSANGVMYAGSDTNGLIFRCATACNTGSNWTVGADTTESGIQALAFDSINKVLYAGNNVIYRCNTSTGCDATGEWTVATDTAGQVSAMLFDPLYRALWAVTYQGLAFRCEVSTACDSATDWTVATVTSSSFGHMLGYDSINGVIYGGSNNNDGLIFRANTRAGAVNISGANGTITFDATSSPSLPAGATDYILNATISNLVSPDAITFGASANKVAEYGETSAQKLTVSGTVSNATHAFPNATISSAANQTFQTGDGETAISAVTVTQVAGSSITSSNGIRLAIATSTGVHMEWDTSDTAASVSGSAQTNGKIAAAPTVTYEGGGTIAVIPVLSTFSAGEAAAISGLSFRNFAFANAATSGLRLLLGGAFDTLPEAQDDKTITIKGTTTIADHALGQFTNQIGENDTATTTAFFRWRATTTGERASTTMTFDLSSVSGVVTGDVANAAVFIDGAGDGAVSASTSWAVAAAAGLSGSSVNSFAYDFISDVLYAGTGSDGVIYRCSGSSGCDADGDWTVATDTGAATIVSLAFDSGRNILYAGSDGNGGGGNQGLVFRCDTSTACDSAADWIVATRTAETTIRPIVLDSARNTLYGASNPSGLIFRCDAGTGCDAGSEWTASANLTGAVDSLVFDSRNGVLYAGGGAGSGGQIFRCATSTGCDADGDWTVATDTSETEINAMVFDPYNAVLYALTSGTDLILRCATSTGCTGATDWTVATDTNGGELYSLIYVPNAETLYAGAISNGIVYRCETATACDGGSDWTVATDTGASHILALGADTKRNVVFAGSQSNDFIFRKFDGDWQPFGTSTVGAVNIAGANGTIAFSGTSTFPAGAADYLLRATISSIALGDTIAFGMASAKYVPYGETSGLKLTTSGSISNILHLRSAASSSLTIASSHVFAVGDAATTLSQLIVTSGSDADLVSAANDIRIAVATATVPMRWDTSITSGTLGGTALGKVTNSFTYEGSDSVLVIPVDTNFGVAETLTISGLKATNFTGAVASSTAFVLLLNGPGDIISTENGSTTARYVAIKGTHALSAASSGSEQNKLNLTQATVSNAEVMSWRLTPGSETVSTTQLVVSLGDIIGVVCSDISGAGIFADFNANGDIDGGDSAVGGSAACSIAGNSGTLTFSQPFGTSTARDYIVRVSVTNNQPEDRISFALPGSNITAAGDTSLQPITTTGSVGKHFHFRQSQRGSSGEIEGGGAPGGGTGGGTGQGGSGTGGGDGGGTGGGGGQGGSGGGEIPYVPSLLKPLALLIDGMRQLVALLR